MKFYNQGFKIEIISIPLYRKRIAEECLILARSNRLKKRAPFWDIQAMQGW